MEDDDELAEKRPKVISTAASSKPNKHIPVKIEAVEDSQNPIPDPDLMDVVPQKLYEIPNNVASVSPKPEPKKRGAKKDANISLTPSEGETAYRFKKRQDTEYLKQKFGAWQDPIAPELFARPFTQKTGKNTFSIGQHLRDTYGDYIRLKREYSTRENLYIFDKWQCYENMVQIIGGETEVISYLPTYAESVDIIVKTSTGSMNPFKVTRFGSHAISMAESGGFVAFLGGSLSCIAWCPSPVRWPEITPDNVKHTYLAACAQTSEAEARYIGTRTKPTDDCQNYNIIQIWDLGILSSAPVTGEEPTPCLPGMALGIIHQEGTIAEMAWCPVCPPPANDDFSFLTNDGQGNSVFLKLGLLAVIFGNGSIAIFAVPHPEAVKSKTAANPPFIQLEPIHTLRLPDGSMPSSIKWSHHGDCSELAVGSHDGSLSIFELSTPSALDQSVSIPSPIMYQTTKDTDIPSGRCNYSIPTESEENDLLNQTNSVPFQPFPLFPSKIGQFPFYFRQSIDTPIIGLAWHPSDPHLVATGGQHHLIKIWDKSDSNQSARSSVLASNSFCMEMDWGVCQGGMEILVQASDDGTVRYVVPGRTRVIEIHHAPVMTASYSHALKLHATGDIDGKVIVGIPVPEKVRGIPPFVCIDHLSYEPASVSEGIPIPAKLFMYSSSTVCANIFTPKEPDTKDQALNSKTPKTQKKPLLPAEYKDASCIVSKIRWNPNINALNWIVYGMRNGLMRIQCLPWACFIDE